MFCGANVCFVMKFSPALSALLLFFWMGATAQQAPVVQRVFSLEEPFQNPAPVPTEVVTGILDEMHHQEGGKDCAENVQTSWLSATMLALNPAGPPALLVKSENDCLNGVNIDAVWIFLKRPAGYRMILSASGLSLEILKTRTRGYLDVEVASLVHGGRHTVYLKYCFKGGEYQLASTRVVTNK